MAWTVPRFVKSLSWSGFAVRTLLETWQGLAGSVTSKKEM
jgi:hypothetical protein